MESVFNVEPHHIKGIHSVSGSFNYDFLDCNIMDKNIKRNAYYDLINTLEDFKLKNLYNFIYLRLLKIHKKYGNFIPISINKSKLSSSELNKKLRQYIDGNILRTIIIMNSIQMYFFPPTLINR